jgi:hypothetical protein
MVDAEGKEDGIGRDKVEGGRVDCEKGCNRIVKRSSRRPRSLIDDR